MSSTNLKIKRFKQPTIKKEPPLKRQRQISLMRILAGLWNSSQPNKLSLLVWSDKLIKTNMKLTMSYLKKMRWMLNLNHFNRNSSWKTWGQTTKWFPINKTGKCQNSQKVSSKLWRLKACNLHQLQWAIIKIHRPKWILILILLSQWVIRNFSTSYQYIRKSKEINLHIINQIIFQYTRVPLTMIK